MTLNIEELNDDYVTMNFRNCVEGEAQINKQCVICDVGTYSLKESSFSCHDCPPHADCLGGTQISVHKDFWRSSNSSYNLIRCLYPHICTGGLIPPDIDPTKDFPLCKHGHGGNLCQVCVESFLLVIIAGLGLLIFVNLRHRKESETSVVLRMMLSYIQIYTSSTSFNLQWPSYMESYLDSVQLLGQTAESFVSIDCLLFNMGASRKSIPTIFLKVAFLSITPIILLALFSAFFVLKKRFIGGSKNQFKRQLIVSLLVIIYTLHPTIVKFITNLFVCLDIENNQSWLLEDMDVQCWQDLHLKWSVLFGFPIITVWMFGVPIWGFKYLYLKRKQLNDIIVFERYRMIYQGLKPKYFYWDFVNGLMKTFITFFDIILSLYSDLFKSLVVISIFTTYLRVQDNIKPYKNPTLNQLEQYMYQLILVTFLMSLIFIQSQIEGDIQLIAFVVIVIFNLRFLILWLMCLLLTFRYSWTLKIASLLRKYILNNEERIKNTNYQTLRTTQMKTQSLHKKRKVPRTISEINSNEISQINITNLMPEIRDAGSFKVLKSKKKQVKGKKSKNTPVVIRFNSKISLSSQILNNANISNSPIRTDTSLKYKKLLTLNDCSTQSKTTQLRKKSLFGQKNIEKSNSQQIPIPSTDFTQLKLFLVFCNCKYHFLSKTEKMCIKNDQRALQVQISFQDGIKILMIKDLKLMMDTYKYNLIYYLIYKEPTVNAKTSKYNMNQIFSWKSLKKQNQSQKDIRK